MERCAGGSWCLALYRTESYLMNSSEMEINTKGSLLIFNTAHIKLVLHGYKCWKHLQVYAKQLGECVCWKIPKIYIFIKSVVENWRNQTENA